MGNRASQFAGLVRVRRREEEEKMSLAKFGRWDWMGGQIWIRLDTHNNFLFMNYFEFAIGNKSPPNSSLPTLLRACFYCWDK